MDGTNSASNRPWVYVRIGEIVGLIPPETYDLYLQEHNRLSRLVDSEKLPPIFGAMVINSVGTPGESLE